MDDHDLMEFVKIYNETPINFKPSTALEWILFLDKNGYRIAKKHHE